MELSACLRSAPSRRLHLGAGRGPVALTVEEDKSPVLSEKRQSERLLLRIPIRVLRFDEGRGEFLEDTVTSAVNAHGARIILNHSRIYPGDTLRIINLENYAEADFEVVGLTSAPGEPRTEWGVACLEPGRNIWDIAFSAPLDMNSAAGALLECRACGRQEFWTLSRMEIDVLEATATIARECAACGKPTYWTYADISRRSREFSPDEPVAPPPRIIKSKEIQERRVLKRIALKLPVLVLDKHGNPERTQSENVTRAGLAVLLRMEMDVGDRVTVYCPHMEGGQNIAQEAEVRWVDTLSGGPRRLYGLRYVAERSDGKPQA